MRHEYAPHHTTRFSPTSLPHIRAIKEETHTHSTLSNTHISMCASVQSCTSTTTHNNNTHLVLVVHDLEDRVVVVDPLHIQVAELFELLLLL